MRTSTAVVLLAAMALTSTGCGGDGVGVEVAADQPASSTTTFAEGHPAPADWTLAPEQELGPDTTTFLVNVAERGCSSGRTPEGRIPPPVITYGADAIDLAFTVIGLPGPQTCQGFGGWIGEVDGEMVSIPYVGIPYTVTLNEPLGDRELTGMAAAP